MLYLKLDGTTILDHDYSQHDDYQTEVEYTQLRNSDGDYIYKYENSQLVSLSGAEITAHPNYKTRKIGELKDQVKTDIQILDEQKAHSLALKKAMGNELTTDETTFVNNFLTQRQSILDQYETDKQQYE